MSRDKSKRNGDVKRGRGKILAPRMDTVRLDVPAEQEQDREQNQDPVCEQGNQQGQDCSHHCECSARAENPVKRHEGSDSSEPQAGDPPLSEPQRPTRRSGPHDLFNHIVPVISRDDLVLPDHILDLLNDILVHVRHSAKVFDEWGFGAKSSHGRGISALFAGPSGTGRRLAAEMLAGELGSDLFQIDLSLVVSKSAGETRKNLDRVFDAAQESGAVLLFDDVDPFFGRRSEDRNRNDRNTSFVAGYLVQRMEEYNGLAILAAVRRKSLDDVFLRRLRFVLSFPLPDIIQREEIWRKVFPSHTPTGDLNIQELAQLELSGGHIREVALYAAFLAAEQNQPVGMAHLRRAAEVIFSKLDMPIISAEFNTWQ